VRNPKRNHARLSVPPRTAVVLSSSEFFHQKKLAIEQLYTDVQLLNSAPAIINTGPLIVLTAFACSGFKFSVFIRVESIA